MIVVIDDDKQYAKSLVKLINSRGHSARCAFTASKALTLVKSSPNNVDCIILDLMMPHGREFSSSATSRGRYTGMQLFTSIRSLLPKVHIFVTTIIRDAHILKWLKDQYRCQVWLKPFDIDDLMNEIDKALFQLGSRLIDRIRKCPPGRKYFYVYEEICVDTLNFLFVPPLPNVLIQARTANGSEIRDAILVNYGASGFWGDIRREFGSNNIPCEFKNYREQIGAKEVQQMRLRLDRPSIGRFGLLFSRLPAAKPALREQRDAYAATPRKLILLLHDAAVIDMIKAKDADNLPETILQKLKTEFEVSF